MGPETMEVPGRAHTRGKAVFHMLVDHEPHGPFPAEEEWYDGSR